MLVSPISLLLPDAFFPYSEVAAPAPSNRFSLIDAPLLSSLTYKLTCSPSRAPPPNRLPTHLPKHPNHHPPPRPNVRPHAHRNLEPLRNVAHHVRILRPPRHQCPPGTARQERRLDPRRHRRVRHRGHLARVTVTVTGRHFSE